MKKIFVTLLIVSVIFMFSSCARSDVASTRDPDEPPESMFVIVEKNGIDGVVVYHKNTKVMYWVSDGGYNSGNLTPLINPDGSPMIYGEDYHEGE